MRRLSFPGRVVAQKILAAVRNTLYCVDPLPELDDEPCYNEHYQDGPLACQVQCHVPKGALDLNDLLLGSVR